MSGSAALVFACVLFLVAPASAQSERSALEEVEAALGEADVDALTERAAERIELTLFGSAAMYSRGQAMYVLAEFFRDYPPRRVDFSDPSRSGGNWFALGEYHYERGEAPLRVFIRLRSNDGTWQLREVRIERSVSQ